MMVPAACAVDRGEAMKRVMALLAGIAAGLVLTGCDDGYHDHGGGGYYGGGGPSQVTQFVAPADDAFVAATDPNNPANTYGPDQGTFAGVRLFITANVEAGSPTTSNQADFAQMFKGSDGHVYAVGLQVAGLPSPGQVSSESSATIDDLCSLNGANAALGTDVNYVAALSYNDYANPLNSVYFYRRPGPSGACNTTEDVVLMVNLGMGPNDSPIAALMPMAVVHDPNSGAITGFVVNEGTVLTMYDQNFANRTVIYTPNTALSVAYSLANSGVSATGGLFVLDGNIVYIDYVQKSASAPLFTVPNWDPTKRPVNSANGTTEFFAVNTSNETATPVVPTSAVYSMPLNGSAAPTLLGSESGSIGQVTVAIYGTTVAWSVVPPGGVYTIRTCTGAGAAPVTAFTSPGNAGNFVATASDIYYTTETTSTPAAATVVYSNTQTGIVAMNGTVVQAPLLDSRFVAEERDDNGSDWIDIVRARNLTPVTVADSANGTSYTEDGVSGSTLEVVDTATNAVTVTLGIMPAGSIMSGSGTLISSAGYFDGLNVNSTGDPATRELIYIDTSQANSLDVLTGSL
jgi:hypothetical protein